MAESRRRADFTTMDTAANRIEGLIADYQKFYNQLFTEVDSLSTSWKQEDGVAFANQIKGFENDFQNMSKELTRYVEALRTYVKDQTASINNHMSEIRGLPN